MRSLTAAAQRFLRQKIHDRAGCYGTGGADDESSLIAREILQLYSEIGELRFSANILGAAAGNATLRIERQDTDGWRPIHDPYGATPGTLTADEKLAEQLLTSLGGDHGMTELIRRLALALFLVGDCYLVGRDPDPPNSTSYVPSTSSPSPSADRIDRINPIGAPVENLLPPHEPDSDPVLGFVWNIYSVLEFDHRGNTIYLDGEEYDPDELLVVRIWRPHPRCHTEADSPVRSTLPVLRELVALTKHVSATIDSRLAGAGVLMLPQSVNVLGFSPGDGDDPAEDDPVIDALMEAMVTPIQDRDAASAVVPIVMTVPDDAVGKAEHIKFNDPLDSTAKDLRDEAIRRLALSWDMPPEMLLSSEYASHWSLFIAQEQFVRTHVATTLRLITSALTHEYLRAALAAAGVKNPTDYKIGFDTSDLLQRPNRSPEAQALFDRGAIDLRTLREASGFEESAAVPVLIEDDAHRLALNWINRDPSLIANTGISLLIAQAKELLGQAPEGSSAPAPPSPDDDQTNEDDQNTPNDSPTRKEQGPSETGPGEIPRTGPQE